MADGPALWSKPSGREIALPHAGTMELWNYGQADKPIGNVARYAASLATTVLRTTAIDRLSADRRTARQPQTWCLTIRVAYSLQLASPQTEQAKQQTELTAVIGHDAVGLPPFPKCIIIMCLSVPVSASSCHLFFSLLATDRINLRTKRYRKCLLVPVYGIFYTVWYVNLFDR